MKTSQPIESGRRQSGAVLLVSLLLLLLITLVGFTMMDTSNLQMKMANTKELKAISFQAAESIVDESLTEPAAIDMLGAALNAHFADSDDPAWPTKTDYAYTGYDTGQRDVSAGGSSETRFLGTASTIGYSIRKGSSGIETYYYEVEADANTANPNIGSTHIQGVFVGAPRLN